MKKVVNRQGSRGQKWVPKGDEKQDEAEVEEEDPADQVQYDTKSEGPHYTRVTLLRAIDMIKKTLDKNAMLVEEMKSLKTEARPEDPKAKRVEPKKASKKRTESFADEEAVGAEGSMTAAMSENLAVHPLYGSYYQSMMMQQMLAAQSAAAAGYTTVMLRHIPNRYTRDMLVERLNQGYTKKYDFVYLPIDFQTKCNVGYAFINFTTPQAAREFMQEFNNASCNKVLPGYSSQKIVEVCYARVQGKHQNMDNLRDEKFVEKLTEHPAWQPLFLDDNHKEIPFKELLADKNKDKRARAGSGSTPTAAAPYGFPMPGAMPGAMPPWAYGYAGPWAGMAPPIPAGTKLANVLPKASPSTMVMLKGVPRASSRESLLEIFNKKFKGQFDFIFVPDDSKSEGQNRGHCFVNFRNNKGAKAFTEEYNGKPLAECFGVEDSQNRTCEVQAARMEGIESTIVKLQSTRSKDKEGKGAAWYPILLDKEGAPQPFPTLAGKGDTPSAPSGGKGKGGKGQGKKGGVPAAQQAALMQYWQQATMMAYSQQAHAQAAAAAAAHAGGAGGGGMLAHLGAAMQTSGRKPKPLSAEAKEAVKKQFEFYYCPDNLCRDMYLRQHMDADGWTSLDLISNFRKIKEYNTTVESIAEALSGCDLLEVEADKRRVRLADPVMRKKWAPEAVAAAPK